MTNSLTASLTSLATTSNQTFMNNVFMQVHNIENNENDAIAYGLDMLTKEPIQVRLSTPDEFTNDLIAMKRARSMDEAKSKASILLDGKNGRECLRKKRDRRHASFLFFERSQKLEPNKYRSHWSHTMSADHDIEMVTGYINIQYRDGVKPNSDEVGKVRAWATVLEYRRDLNIQDPKKNYEMISHSLKPILKSGGVRDSLIKLVAYIDGKPVSETTIRQHYAETSAKDHNNQLVKFMAPQTAEQSISHFMTFKGDNINSYTASCDIGKVILNCLCDLPIDKQYFSSQDDAYLSKMREIHQQIQSGAMTVKVYSGRIFRFGSETIQKLAPTDKFNPLKVFNDVELDEFNQPTGHYTELYIPTVLILHKTPNNRRYIAFWNRMYHDQKNLGKPVRLTDLDETLGMLPIKTESFSDQ